MRMARVAVVVAVILAVPLMVAALAGPFVVDAAPSGAAPAAAAAAASDEARPPVVVQALLGDVDQVESKLMSLSEAIPESAWQWRPADGVRSVGEVVMHVAADNWFIPAMVGFAPPAETGISGDDYESVMAYEAREMSKAEALATMRASFEHLRGIMNGLDEASLVARHDVFGTEMSGLELWVMTTTHLHEHLGQQIAYARSNGVVPPWSQ